MKAEVCREGTSEI